MNIVGSTCVLCQGFGEQCNLNMFAFGMSSDLCYVYMNRLVCTCVLCAGFSVQCYLYIFTFGLSSDLC